MLRYEQFQPTGFDMSGLGLPERQNWLVAPVGRNRDSEALEESNFTCFLKLLGGESETVEVHRFGHWGAGWFEIILIDPTDVARVESAENLGNELADYPALDEEDLARREIQ